MTYEFKLPDIGEGLTEGEVTKWHVKVGDKVVENQPLASVLTDKAEVEVPSPKSGTVTKLFAKPGEKVKVHAPLVALEVSDGSAVRKPAPEAAPERARNEPPAKMAPISSPPSPAPAAGSGGSTFTFKLPDIGEGLTEGEVTKWHVKVGDTVAENQPIANVLTDKAEVEIPSPRAGKIAKLYAKPGEKVRVHAALVDLEPAGGGKTTQQTRTAEAAHAAQPNNPAASRERSAGPAASTQGIAATPMVRQLAKKLGVDIAQVHGTGPEGRVLEKDVKAFSGGNGHAAPASPPRSTTTANATPAVQRLAQQLGVDLARVQGTGPGGRIAEWDVRKATATTTTPAAPSPALPAGRGAATSAVAPLPPSAGPEERVPFVGIRRKIAEKMAQSVHTVAHVTHMDECDMTALVALREKLKKDAEKKGVKLTFMAFIIKAVVKALKEFPGFNSSLDEQKGELVKKLYYNVGIAVNAGQGLIVPNIKKADEKDLWALAGEVSQLAERVRAGKIDVASLQGGTFTLTNIGPLGGLFATPIVNHPEVAILGIMKLQKRPMVVDGKVQVRDMMNLVLSFDHRIVDGADAAQFMNVVVKSLENPRTLL
jgi:pyruvate dehydrogenase E2 component (dihydrolipoamide acetyltransferase)